MIDELKKAYPITTLCAAMDYPRSSYYASRRMEADAGAEELVLTRVRAIHQRTRGSYGSRRMSVELARQGLRIGRHKARSLMRRAGVEVVRVRRSHRYGAAVGGVVPNRLERQFKVARPNRVWVSDITSVATGQGWVHLAIVVDLFARRIVGWAIAPHATTTLVLKALEMAVQTRHPGQGLMFHSDQGSQYTSSHLAQRLQALRIVQSMSRRGNCWDNAVAERVFAALKTEWLRSTYASRSDATADITTFVTTYYNHYRLHSAIGQTPPALYEALAA